MRDLEGQTALVTGASRGIGRATALRLATQGARVLVHYAQRQDLATQVAELCGNDSRALGLDMTRLPDFDGFVEQVQQQFGHLDILVHNAGLAKSLGLTATREEDFDALVAVNLKGPFFLTQKLLPLLAPRARVVFLSSVVARLAYPGDIAYSLTKAAIETLTLQLAALLGDRGITVNAVAPGTIETEMCPWLQDPQQRQATMWQQALQRIGQPDDIAGVVEFLVSPRGSWMTGQVLVASGGLAL